MITKKILKKEFVGSLNKLSSKEFISRFVNPIEKKLFKKNNLSEHHDDYLLKIRKGNI